jgi:cation-transporting P-type ATPase 13A2
MASCHSITYIDGELLGDPLDIKMFESTGWVLDECNEASNQYAINDLILAYVRPTSSQLIKSMISFEEDDSIVENQYELAIVKRFDFESALQRMSVIVKNLKDNTFRSYVKGSPEKMKDLCNPESIPNDFHQ